MEIAELFATTKQNVSLHIQNILKKNELRKGSVVKESLTTAADGKNYRTRLYRLELILAVGYQVKTPRGTQFRQWARTKLAEYLIYRAFKPYYDATSLQEGSDPHRLEQLKFELDAAQVYFWSEVEAFARIFYNMPANQAAQDHAQMQRHLQPAVDRFKAMQEEKRSEFRDKLGGYVRLYSFLSQVIPYTDPAWEMLYSYGRFLVPHLPLGSDTERLKLGDEVSLQYYRLQRIHGRPGVWNRRF